MQMSYRLYLKPGETCVARVAPTARSRSHELAHGAPGYVAPLAHSRQTCAGELSSIAQALKTSADELPS